MASSKKLTFGFLKRVENLASIRYCMLVTMIMVNPVCSALGQAQETPRFAY